MTDQTIPDVTDKDSRLARDWAEHIINTPESSLPMETAAAPALAALAAGMRPEYAVSLPDGQLVGAGWGTHDTAQEDQRAWSRDGFDTRIVRRYVTTEEEA